MEEKLPEDLANLSELDEKSLLEVLTGRFTQNLIYVSNLKRVKQPKNTTHQWKSWSKPAVFSGDDETASSCSLGQLLFTACM